MSVLKAAIISAFKEDARFPAGNYPETVPVCVVSRAKFVEAGRVLKKAYALLAAEWATDETPYVRGYCIYACYRYGSEYLIVKSDIPLEDPVFPSLTKHFVSAYRFERQIVSLLGLTADKHPDTRPWIKFEDWPADAWPLRKTFDASKRLPRVKGDYKWARAEGEGVYEIPVGPVHAGII